MYHAKSDGCDRYSVYDRDQRRDLSAGSLSWLQRLRHAIDEDLFVLYAQPIIGICGNGVPRYELLLRMRGDAGELIPPAAFLYNAERFDLIGSIDRWVLRKAVTTIHDETAAGRPLSLTVNLAGKTMNDPALAADLAAMLAASPIPGGRLVIEVTEAAALVNIGRVRDLADELHNLGCLLSLDDFGSGFASFYYLKHLNFDFLKIDGEFIVKLSDSSTDQLVVRALVGIAHGLQTKTVAKCVGDESTRELLRTLGVDYGQGYHLGRPVSIGELLAGIQHRHCARKTADISRAPAQHDPGTEAAEPAKVLARSMPAV
jgi:EAL domain-containing protein (putative c-di-GMP-specific phosphodiesterase class I)